MVRGFGGAGMWTGGSREKGAEFGDLQYKNRGEEKICWQRPTV